MFVKSLSTLSVDELKLIKEVLENKELQEDLNQLLVVREIQPFLVEKYQSSRLPEFYNEYKEKCSYLLSQLTYNDVKFLEASCGDVGNNMGGRFYLREPVAYERASMNVGYLEAFFDGDNQNVRLYEGVYNTLNYMRSSICRTLHDGITLESKQDLFKDYDEKFKIAFSSIREIAAELFELKMKIPNSRISVSNQTLTKTTQKKGQSITIRQENLINAVIFGSSLESLKNKDYSNAKRLLFVPRNGVNKGENV